MYRAWRRVVTSHSSLWTDLECADADKTLVYFERSKSSPINLSLRKKGELSFHDPFFQITPHVIRRLKSLSVQGMLEDLQDIAAHLSHPAPLLEDVSISSNCKFGLEGAGHPHIHNLLRGPLFVAQVVSGRRPH